jgi:serine/threonine-protein kinase
MPVGRRPFESTSLTGVLTAHIMEAPKPPNELRPDISPAMNAIILRCLAKDPTARYANAGELLAEMDEYRSAAA